MDQANLQEKPFLRLGRSFAASPEKVWRAWTDPAALGQWFRPEASFTVPLAEADVRVGGRFRVLMVNARGEEFDLNGIYREVVSGRKLVMTWGWKNQSEHESLVTVDFLPQDGGTQLELRHDQYRDFENEPSHEQGWNGAFDKLERLLRD